VKVWLYQQLSADLLARPVDDYLRVPNSDETTVCSYPRGRNGAETCILVKHIKTCVSTDGLLEDEIVNTYLWLVLQREMQLRRSALKLGILKKKLMIVDSFFFTSLWGSDEMQT